MTLPETWTEVRLTDVCDLNPRSLPEDRPNDDLLVTFVPMSAVNESAGVIDKPEVRTFGEVAKGYTSFRERDVLFAKVTPCMENGKAAVARGLMNGIGFGSTEFHVLRPTPAVLPEFLLRFIRQQAFRDRAAAAFVGTGGLQRVPPDFFSRVKLQLPSIPEQQRIVDVLEQAEFFSQADERRGYLDQVIKSALDRLVLGSEETTWRQLGSLAETRYGTSVPADATRETGVPVLRIPNVIGGEIDINDMKYVELSHAELTRLRLTTDDVLIVRTNGNPEYVGRAAPVSEDICQSEIVYASYLIRLRTDAARLLPEYLSAFLNSTYGRAAMRNAIRTTAGQSNLNGENLVKVRLPIPELAEQQQFRRLWLHVREIRRQIARSEDSFTELRAALSIHALSGDLTAQWRNSRAATLADSARGRDELLRERGAKIAARSATATALAEPPDEVIARPARHWLLSELSDFQRQVFAAFTSYCQASSEPLLVEDPEVFARFCNHPAIVERLQPYGASHGNRIRRTLSQLASLGLIAKVTFPRIDQDSGDYDYLKVFRPLRGEEFTRMADLKALRKALSPNSDQHYYFQAQVDYEASERAGAGGMFQVISIEDGEGKDYTHLVDQGTHYASLSDLRVGLAIALGVLANQVDVEAM